MLKTKRNRSISPKENIENIYLSSPPNFNHLGQKYPSFSPYVKKTKYNTYTIDWKNGEAVRELTKCLLNKDFGIQYYELPNNYLIPTLPSRLNYILYLKKLYNIFGIGAKSKNTHYVFDVGTGANLVYPILGSKMFNWNFVCSEINNNSIKIANNIIQGNNIDPKKIVIIKQNDSTKIFDGILDNFQKFLQKNKFIFSMCNPPYYDYENEIKFDNSHTDNEYNFEEVYTKGGEKQFILQMIKESETYKNKIFIFTSLVGKKKNFLILKEILQKNKKLKFLKFETFFQGKNARWVLAWGYHENYESFINQNSLWVDKEFINYKPKIISQNNNIYKLSEI